MPSRTAQIRLVSSHREVYEPCDDSFTFVKASSSERSYKDDGSHKAITQNTPLHEVEECDSDDALLADQANLLQHEPKLCMELGCGSGYVITSLALILGKEGHFIATDINPHAVRVTQETREAHGVHADVINTNIASGLEKRLAGLVDVIVVNPPYVPTPEDEVGREGIASACAWAGGENGRSVIDKVLPVADSLLSEKGWLYMVTLSENNPTEICLQMREKGYASRILVQGKTEEESLQIIKFWRDLDSQLAAKEMAANKTVPSKIMESLRSQFPKMSFLNEQTR